MFRLLYRLVVQRVNEYRLRRQSSRKTTSNPNRSIIVQRLIIIAVLIAGVVIFFTVFRSQLELKKLTTDPESAQLHIQLGSVQVPPMVVYLEKWPPVLTPVPENDEVSQILIRNSQFIPTFQVVSPGSTLEIINTDTILHNAHVISGNDTVFNVATPLTSIKVKKTLTATGMLNVRCDLHPYMHSWIFVPANPHHAIVREAGAITFTGIEPGDYRLHIWEAGRFRPEATITLRASETKTLRGL